MHQLPYLKEKNPPLPMMQEKGSEPQQVWRVVKRETISPAQNLSVWPVASHYTNCAILIMLVIQF